MGENDRCEEVVALQSTLVSATPFQGEMARRVYSFDWSQTPLGPRAQWPGHLRTAVDICLRSRIPLMIAWGPEAIQIYNDALAPLLGDKHPAALGRSYADSFAEIWHYQEPRFLAALEGGHSTYDEDQQICFWRNGMLEEMYYTFSWSPITDQHGDVRGVLHPATETTGYVVGARRLSALQALAAGTVAPRSSQQACRMAATALQDHRHDVPFALIYLLGEEGQARLVASMGIEAGEGIEAHEGRAVRFGVDSPADRWAIGEALREGSRVVEVDSSLATSLVDPPWPEPCRQAMVLPFAGAKREDPSGVLVAGISPRRPLDHEYVTWLNLVAAQFSHAQAAAEEHERERNVAVTLQRSLLPERLPVVDGIALEARYEPALEYPQVGGDWYDAVCVDDDRVVVVAGDVMGKGAQAAAAMGRLRSAAQAYAMLGLAPAAILDQLNRFAVKLDEVELATVVCGAYQASTGRVTFASAGHLPPVLVSEPGSASPRARLLEGGLTVPLAVSDELRAEEVEVSLARGDTLVLYTDGLVERRDAVIDEGLAKLLSVCTGHDGDLASLLDTVMQRVATTDSRDDTALLALRRVG